MNLINELRMLAEELGFNGHSRYAAALSKAADEIEWLRAKNDRMNGAMESLLIRCGDPDSAMYGTLSTSFVRDIARIARGT